MTARRAARAIPSDGRVIAGARIPRRLLNPDDEVWRNDEADLAGLDRRAGEAACWLGRRQRHRTAVTKWAVEHDWTDPWGRANRARLLKAGVPLPGYALRDGAAVPIPDDQLQLYRVHLVVR